MSNWMKVIDILKAVGEMYCPLATHDIKVNTKNRDLAIHSEHIKYGPINIADTGYWVKLAKHWSGKDHKVSVAAAKKSRCGNCAAFDVSARMENCMPGSVSKSGRLGYCWMHKFKCHSSRVCYTWVAGGPIKSDKVSQQWEKKGSSDE